jgi:hypothetical protein
LPGASRAVLALIEAGIAMRRLHTQAARAALERATQAARIAGIAALAAEVEQACHILNAPAARVLSQDNEQALRLEEVEALFNSKTLVIDACRNAVRVRACVIPLATRPVLFTLARMLGQAWPGDVARDALIAQAFRIRRADETHRARLRVEMGRLRALLAPLACIDATANGFALAPREAKRVAVLAPLVDDGYASVLAFLSDGESWSSSALALALNASQRTVQRALDALASKDKVQAIGRGRARRWITPPMPGFATALLLPAALASD